MKKTAVNERLEAAKTASAIFMNPQMDFDRNYFTLHPKQSSYIREPFPHEVQQGLFLDGREPKKMEVFNIGNGLRCKKFLY